MKSGTSPKPPAMAGAQAVRRAMDAIRAVAQLQRTGATLSRIAVATGLNASTAFRILRSLTEERMLRYDELEKHYHLGLLAFELGLATVGQSQVQGHWRATVEHVARRTRLTSYLMARSDNEAVCLLCVQGSTMIRAMPLETGQRLPLGIGAGSMALLATLDDAEVRSIVRSLEPRLRQFPDGERNAERIEQGVAQTRMDGYAVTRSTVAKGLAGIGVAVKPQTGLLQLALSVSAVTDTIDANETRQIAAILSQAIADRVTAEPV